MGTNHVCSSGEDGVDLAWLRLPKKCRAARDDR